MDWNPFRKKPDLPLFDRRQHPEGTIVQVGKVQIGGPTGAFIVVVASVVHQHGVDGLLTATLMAGVTLTLAAVTRVASLIRFVPEAVVNGFTIGIAIVIAASQLGDLLGISLAEMPAEFVPKLVALWEARAFFNPAALTRPYQRMNYTGVVIYPREPFVALGADATPQNRFNLLSRMGKKYIANKSGGGLLEGN